MILVVDHFDSFVETLARYVREAGADTHVRRLRTDDVAELVSSPPDGIILSPGPCRPADAPATMALLRCLPRVPFFGVCLGHQAICEAAGGSTERAAVPTHGRASAVHHDGDRLFDGIPSPFDAARYHSLLGQPPADGSLTVIARLADGTPMAVRHETLPRVGVQFHPESLLTTAGRRIMENALTEMVGKAR